MVVPEKCGEFVREAAPDSTGFENAGAAPAVGKQGHFD